MGPILKQVYLQMAEPRWVMAVGACASSGGILILIGVAGDRQVIPVDVYVPGCPPRPDSDPGWFIRIQDLVGQESLRRRNSEQYKNLLQSYGIHKNGKTSAPPDTGTGASYYMALTTENN